MENLNHISASLKKGIDKKGNEYTILLVKCQGATVLEQWLKPEQVTLIELLQTVKLEKNEKK